MDLFTVGDELAASGTCALLAPGVAVDATVNGPFRKHRGAGLEFARLPVGGELVFVGVVLDECTGRVLEVPEIGRGDRVSQPQREMCMPPPKTSWMSRTVKATWFSPASPAGRCSRNMSWWPPSGAQRRKAPRSG